MYHSATLRPSVPIEGPTAIHVMASWRGFARIFDVVIASLALVFFLPLMTLIALTIYACDPGPILFAQRRIGHGGHRFGCFKFRSMVVDAEQRLAELLENDPVAQAEWGRDHKLRNDPRITLIGNILRKSSLDELPQIFNVLRGEMSIVGPRPIVDAEVIRYGRYFAHYCYVRPGITGLWQVSGRNDVTYRRRVAFDVIYSRRRSILLDLRILFMTIPSVLKARGCY